ncbi:hypothetical protein VTN02DRAFT_2397 [Thermoascus thermophilus]
MNGHPSGPRCRIRGSTFSGNIFNQSVRVDEGLAPTTANTIMQYVAAGHGTACIVRHIDDVYQCRLRQETIDALVDGGWDYTDDPAPMYFPGGDGRGARDETGPLRWEIATRSLWKRRSAQRAARMIVSSSNWVFALSIFVVG